MRYDIENWPIFSHRIDSLLYSYNAYSNHTLDEAKITWICNCLQCNAQYVPPPNLEPIGPDEATGVLLDEII